MLVHLKQMENAAVNNFSNASLSGAPPWNIQTYDIVFYALHIAIGSLGLAGPPSIPHTHILYP